MSEAQPQRLALDEEIREEISFGSILSPIGTPAEIAEQPAFFRDLNLDQIVAAVSRRKPDYALEPYFNAPLESSDEIEYRQEVFRDLERDEIRAAAGQFAERLWRVRAYLGSSQKQQYKLERERWILDAALQYCQGVAGIREALDEHPPGSRGLRGLRDFAARLLDSTEFEKLRTDAEQVADALGRIRYAVRIRGRRVSVGEPGDEADYTQEVERIFDRFRQGGEPDHLAVPADTGSMDSVEAQIAQLVARRYRQEFALLESFCSSHRSLVDPTLARFEREIQFYLAWREHMAELSACGLPFCHPVVATEPKVTHAEGAYDLALAAKLKADDDNVVLNGFSLSGKERVLVVTGPNQGGKTTFARMFGQLHHLGRLGVPVPASEARLFLADRLFTHFERQEDVGALHGKLDDELIRVKEILEDATAQSIVIVNEVFASTTLADAVLLGGEVLERLIEDDCLAVCVTFVDELASLGEETVSMVAEVETDDPSKRTFRIVRRQADGRAYAFAVAAKYGLSYERIRDYLRR